MPDIPETKEPEKPSLRICRAVGCQESIETLYSFCRPHWYQIPPTLQRAIWEACRPGRVEHLRPTVAWIEAMASAIEWLAERENQPTINRFREVLERRSANRSTVENGAGQGG